jgi:hypothetical protein
MNNSVYSLALDSAHNLYAGGAFTMAGGAPANAMAKWDGNSWLALGSGINNAVFSLAADKAGRLYAGGAFNIAGTNVSAFVAQANVLDTIFKISRNPDGGTMLDLLTTPYASSRVLTSTNVALSAAWQPIYTNVAPGNGAWRFTDTSAGLYPTRYYRSATP